MNTLYYVSTWPRLRPRVERNYFVTARSHDEAKLKAFEYLKGTEETIFSVVGVCETPDNLQMQGA